MAGKYSAPVRIALDFGGKNNETGNEHIEVYELN